MLLALLLIVTIYAASSYGLYAMELRRSACDTCRRRRVRCDSSQPCRRCVDSGVTCTYGSIVSRQSSTAYARSLEQQIARLQAHLQAIQGQSSTSMNAVSSSDDDIQPQHIDLQPQRIDTLTLPGNDYVFDQPVGRRVYSHASTLNLLRTITDLASSGVPDGSSEPGRAILAALETPLVPPTHSPLDWLSALLPPQSELQNLITVALDEALICHECVDRDALRTRLATVGFDTQARDSKSFLAVVYALLALGARFKTSDTDNHSDIADSSDSPKGTHYFRASLYIVHQQREQYDLDLVRALTLQSRYLLYVSTFSDAHASLLSAASAAMHLGLHLYNSQLQNSFTASELYERRKVFAVIYSMEVGLAFALGLPRCLQHADQRQTLGLQESELADEGATMIATYPFSPPGETVMEQRMLRLYASIQDDQSAHADTSGVFSDRLTMAKTQLSQWAAMLPELSEASHDRRALLGQCTLRLIYTAGQILLYSPYLHHLARDNSDLAFSIDGFEHGSACVSAAMQAVLLIETMHSHAIMHEAYWLTRYLLVWAANILSFFVSFSKARVTIEEGRSAALRARDLLGTLGLSNATAKRMYDIIDPAIDRISTIRS